jgi:hypothetical protein
MLAPVLAPHEHPPHPELERVATCCSAQRRQRHAGSRAHAARRQPFNLGKCEEPIRASWIDGNAPRSVLFPLRRIASGMQHDTSMVAWPTATNVERNRVPLPCLVRAPGRSQGSSQPPPVRHCAGGSPAACTRARVCVLTTVGKVAAIVLAPYCISNSPTHQRNYDCSSSSGSSGSSPLGWLYPAH